MDEWLQVNFPEVRDVLVDGTICGTTNRPFMVQRGTHTVSLGGPQDYTQPALVSVVGTSRQQPLIVTIVQIGTPDAGATKKRKASRPKTAPTPSPAAEVVTQQGGTQIQRKRVAILANDESAASIARLAISEAGMEVVLGPSDGATK